MLSGMGKCILIRKTHKNKPKMRSNVMGKRRRCTAGQRDAQALFLLVRALINSFKMPVWQVVARR